jgi:hypothetical protein
MTQDEIIEMAGQAGFVEYELDDGTTNAFDKRYEAFATLVAAKAIAGLESQEPVAWVDLQKEAQQIVESKVLWKKFIDGTPLVNDIACWMADFVQQYAHPPQLEQNFCPRCGKRTNNIHTCTPPQRSESSGKPSAWVGLTDEDELDWDGGDLKSLVKAIEARLKELNT